LALICQGAFFVCKAINPKYAINFIADVEQSLIEGNISKSLETEVEEFRALLNRVQEDTTGHKQLLLSLRKQLFFSWQQLVCDYRSRE
jgi:hypothetical protein